MKDPRIAELSQDPTLPFWPLLKKVDKLMPQEKFRDSLDILEPVNQAYPNQPSVLVRLLSLHYELDDPSPSKECALSLRAYFEEVNFTPSPRLASHVSQCLFHCYTALGEFDAAEAEGQEHFSKNPGEESPYREGYRNLCNLRQKRTDAEIAETLQNSG